MKVENVCKFKKTTSKTIYTTLKANLWAFFTDSLCKPLVKDMYRLHTACALQLYIFVSNPRTQVTSLSLPLMFFFCSWVSHEYTQKLHSQSYWSLKGWCFWLCTWSVELSSRVPISRGRFVFAAFHKMPFIVENFLSRSWKQQYRA